MYAPLITHLKVVISKFSRSLSRHVIVPCASPFLFSIRICSRSNSSRIWVGVASVAKSMSDGRVPISRSRTAPPAILKKWIKNHKQTRNQNWWNLLIKNFHLIFKFSKLISHIEVEAGPSPDFHGFGFFGGGTSVSGCVSEILVRVSRSLAWILEHFATLMAKNSKSKYLYAKN